MASSNAITIDISQFVDNSKEVNEAVNQAIETALMACGLQAEGYAKDIITNASRVDTGLLRNSIKAMKDGTNRVVVGTPLDYAIYHEVGTGIYAEDGTGRQTPWIYKDKRTGEVYLTRGVKPLHFIRDSIQDHEEEYKNIIEEALKTLK